MTDDARNLLQLTDAIQNYGLQMVNINFNSRIRKLMDDKDVASKGKQIKLEELMASCASAAERFNAMVGPGCSTRTGAHDQIKGELKWEDPP